jgi:hypothetical protein
VYDEEGNLLNEKPIYPNEVGKWKKIAAVQNKIEDLIQTIKSSHEDMDSLVSSVMNIEASFDHVSPSSVQAPWEEYKSFIGCKIPKQIEIHPPTDIPKTTYDMQEEECLSMMHHGPCQQIP